MSTFDNAALSHGAAATQVLDNKVELVQFPVKRIADVVASLVVVVALALPAAVIALILKAGSEQIVAKQLVAGKNGGFVEYSFRTDDNGFGSFLATTGLNIIPTIFNVLRGDMALVELVPNHDSAPTSLSADARIIAKALTSAFTA